MGGLFVYMKHLSSIRGPDIGLFRVRYDILNNPRNDKDVKVTVLESEDSANVLAFTREGKIIIVDQYRFGIGENTLELPGGLLEPNEEPLAAIQRELKEETGYTRGTWTLLGTSQSNPVYMDSLIYHYLVVGVEKTDDLVQDDAEHIVVLEMEEEEVMRYVQEGKIQHPHVLAALFRWTLYRK